MRGQARADSHPRRIHTSLGIVGVLFEAVLSSTGEP